MTQIHERLRRLNFVIITIVVLYTVAFVKITAAHPVVNSSIDAAIAFLTSIGFYQILLSLIYELVGRFRFLLKLYWGELFLEGLWSYRYTLEGADDNKVYFGLWRFKQSLYETRVVGFGLSDTLGVRSRVRSISDMLGSDPMYEFINVRSDSIDSGNEYYSRTNMFFEPNKNRLLPYPVRMRGKTIMYGGPLTGRICNNLFVRHEKAVTEQDVIDELRQLATENGGALPPP